MVLSASVIYQQYPPISQIIPSFVSQPTLFHGYDACSAPGIALPLLGNPKQDCHLLPGSFFAYNPDIQDVYSRHWEFIQFNLSVLT